MRAVVVAMCLAFALAADAARVEDPGLMLSPPAESQLAEPIRSLADSAEVAVLTVHALCGTTSRSIRGGVCSRRLSSRLSRTTSAGLA